MTARIFASGVSDPPRRTRETPVFVHIEYPEHIARSCAAIRQRWRNESAVVDSRRSA